MDNKADFRVRSSHPVTPVQHGMIFHHLSDPSAGVDLEQCVGDFDEVLDVSSLRRAWTIVSARHEVLHARFRWEGLTHPVVDVLDEVAPSVLVEDLSSKSAHEQVAIIDRYLGADRVAGFNFAEAPLHRVKLFLLSDGRSKMVWTYSHAILDNSTNTVLREVLEAYDALRAGVDAPYEEKTPFSKHLDWLQDHLKEQASSARAFWGKKLDGFASPTGITPRSDSGTTDASQGTADLCLSLETTEKLRALGDEHDLSLNNFFQAAWSLVLGQHAAASDVVFGVTRACRRSSLPEVANSVGLFINTLPLRVRLDSRQPLLEFVADVRAQNRDVSAFEHTSLVDVQRGSQLSSGTDLFSSIVVFNPRHNNTQLHLDGVAQGRNFDWIDQTNFPLTVFGYGDEQLLLRVSYQRKLISDETARTLLRQMEAALADFSQQPKKTVGEVKLVGEEAIAWLEAQKGTSAPYESRPLHELFEQQVEKTPQATALTHEGIALTYEQLNSLANDVAQSLREAGLSDNAPVGIHASRSLEMVAGLLGILKAGGAYVPLDPEFPRERLQMMIEDSRMGLILAQPKLTTTLPEHRARVVDLPAAVVPDTLTANLNHSVQSSDLSYVIFTSGSTGRPKGVMLEHRHVSNFFAGMDERLGTDPGVWLAVTSISFDISVLELFWTLTRGFHVVLQEEDPKSGRQGETGPSMEFGLFYFGGEAGADVKDKYRLLLEGVKYADANDFTSAWTPERHFHEFGGLYPNPALTGAAIAACTKQIHIRAGSVVAPLHSPVRLAEEWSVVDNISGGRVGLSVASGWHPNDFVIAPDRFQDRRQLMFDHLDKALRLWKGESITLENGIGEKTQVQTYPRPIQEAPPIWVTAGGSPITFEKAGERGANILTNLLVQSEEELADRIQVYRAARKKAGHTGPGKVTLMLHTFLGDDVEEVRGVVRGPLTEYLKTATALVNRTRWEMTTFATGYKGKDGALKDAKDSLPSLDSLSQEERDAIMEHAFNRYFNDQGLFGTAESSMRIVERFQNMGVTEIASLIDFGLETDVVLEGLKRLNDLRLKCTQMAPVSKGRDFDLASLIERHTVTHFQCTPSLARMIAADAEQLSALRTVGTILLGGEALPKDLATQIKASHEGKLLNMYGPTETTVWSACSIVERGASEITIGSANVNTTVVILDAEQRPVAPGVVGEIYIGGESVARGYIHREDLTKERFVNLKLFGEEARFYRTGDLGRYREDGKIDFLGRTDHQVKISGYRIELGEIESAIATTDGVLEAAVVARSDNGSQPQLVAYVVPDKNGEAPTDSLSETWQKTWDQTYSAAERTEETSDMDTAGWISSLTGEQIPEGEMQEWVDTTVARILSLSPKRVLEVGCGTGMLALPVAAACEHYTGADFSESALARLGAKVKARGISNIDLKCAAADGLSNFPAGSFDTIVINSVAQYFPSVEYLLQVIDGLVRLVAPGGKILFGDIRDKDQKEVFYLAAELCRADLGVQVSEFKKQVNSRAQREAELVLSPDFFESLASVVDGVSAAEVFLRPDRAQTEMSRFRYDAVLTVGEAPPAADYAEVTKKSATSLDDVKSLARGGEDEILISNLENRRVARDWRAKNALEATSGSESRTLGVWLESIGPDSGVDPAELASLTDYDVRLFYARSGDPSRFDAYLSRKNVAVPPRAWKGAKSVSSRDELKPFANVVSKTVSLDSLVANVRETAKKKLPAYMVPATFVTLEKMPLTPNGKLDRKRLPKPEGRKRATQKFEEPGSELEKTVAKIWREMLNLDRISAQDNFFDLGANSLMMVQAQGKLKAALDQKPSLVDLFRYPTVQRLAKFLGGASSDIKLTTTRSTQAASKSVSETTTQASAESTSTSSADSRREALRRRRQQARAPRGT